MRRITENNNTRKRWSLRQVLKLVFDFIVKLFRPRKVSPTTTIYGWDLSQYDHDRGPVNMKAAKADGISFVTAKACEQAPGQIFYNKYMKQDLNAAKAEGFELIGAYVVVRTGVPVATQAKTFIDYLDSQIPWWRTFDGWFFQMDTEKWPYDAVGIQLAVDMIYQIRVLTGAPIGRVVHYVSKGQYGNSVPGTDPLWNANYGDNAAGQYKVRYGLRSGDSGAGWVVYSGRMPQVWQYGSANTIGTQPMCDANAYRGTVLDFKKMIKAPSTQVIVPPKADYVLPHGLKVKGDVVIGSTLGAINDVEGTKIVAQHFADVIDTNYPKASDLTVIAAYLPTGGGYHAGGRVNNSRAAAIDLAGTPEAITEFNTWWYGQFSDLSLSARPAVGNDSVHLASTWAKLEAVIARIANPVVVPPEVVPPVVAAIPVKPKLKLMFDNIDFGPKGSAVYNVNMKQKAFVERFYPAAAKIGITSATDSDHGTNSYHYGKLYLGSNASAIDYAGSSGPGDAVAMRDYAKWWYDNFGDLLIELIHTTPFSDDEGFYVHNQKKYPGGGPYVGATAAAHENHVHVATSYALLVKIEERAKKKWPDL